MTNRGSILILAYSNGKMIQGDEGVMYDGPDPTMFRISSLATFEVLKQKIHSVLNLEGANQEVSKVTYRFPISANKYKPVQLKNNEDVRCMLSNQAKHPNLSAIELFIDKNTRQTRLSQSQTSAGDRSRPQLTKMATREHIIRCSKQVHVSQVPKLYNLNQLIDTSFQLRNDEHIIRSSKPVHVSQLTKLYNLHQLIDTSFQLRNDGNGVVDCMFDDHRRCPSPGARQMRGSLKGGSLKGVSLKGGSLKGVSLKGGL